MGLGLLAAQACAGSSGSPPGSAPPPPAATCPPLPASANAAAHPTAAPRQVIQGTHAGAITDIVFAPSGRLLATSGADGTARVWDPTSLHELLVLRLGRSAHLTWLPGETELVAAMAGFRDGAQSFSAVRADVARGTTRPLAFPTSLYRIARVSWADGTRWVGATYDDVQRFDEEGRALGVLAKHEPPWRPRHETLEVSDDGRVARIALDDDSKGPFDTRTKTLAWDDGLEREAHAVEARFDRAAPGEAARIAAAAPGLRASSVARSRDGQRLFVGGTRESVRGEGVLAFIEAAGGAPVRELRFPDLGARDQWAPGGDEIRPLVVSPDGERVAAGSWDGRVWMVNARSFALLGALGGDRAPRIARDLAFTGDGRLLVLSEDHVSAFSLSTGQRRGSFFAPGVIRFSRDGEALDLVAAREKGCLVLDRLDPSRGVTPGTPRCTLPHLVDALSSGYKVLATGGGRQVFSGLDSTRLLDLARATDTPLGADEPRCTGATVPASFASDGSYAVSWSYRGRMDRSTYCVFDGASGKTRGVLELPRAASGVLSADARALGQVREGALTVYALPGGEPRWSVALEGDERLEALGPGGRVAILRSEARFRVVGEGKVLGQSALPQEEPAPSRLDESGRWAVAPGAEGGLRIWDLSRMTHAVTFVDFRDDEWIAMSPAGAYTGTSEVADRVGWVYEKPLEHFSFEQFSSTFRDPALIAARLRGEATDAGAAVARPPRVEILDAPVVDADGHTAHVRARVSSGGRVETLRAFVEGRPVAERAVCAAEGEVALDLPLLPGHNRLHLVAFDSRGFSSNPAIAAALAPRDPARRPDVWVVAVGVSRYPRLPESMQLGVAHEDARAVAAAMRAQEGKSYAHAHLSTLLDEQATPAGIRAAIAGLSAMAPDDVALIFFAGHGFKLGAQKEMVFATAQVKLDAAGTGVDEESAVADSVGWAEIAEGIAGARGRVLVMLDACHSGHLSQELVVPNAAMAADLSRSGRAGAVVFAAAKGRQQSLEPANSRGLELSVEQRALVTPPAPEPHGFFTGALLTALRDPATDRDGSGSIELSEIVDEVTRRVSRASGGAQTPWVARRDMFGDFALVERPGR